MTENIASIDQETFISLQEMIGEDSQELLLEIIETYLTESQFLKEKILQGVENEDSQIIEDIAHSLKSTSRLIGALNLAQIVHQLELIGKQKLLPNSDLICQLTKEHLKVIIELEKKKVQLENELF